MGAHQVEDGVHFAVWAPNADTCRCHRRLERLAARRDRSAAGQSGIWEGFARASARAPRYKYRIGMRRGAHLDKADPFAVAPRSRRGPRRWSGTATTVGRRRVDGDPRPAKRPATRRCRSTRCTSARGAKRAPTATRSTTAPPARARRVLAQLGFTHVELMPVMEHPFYGSWGYQATGYFAPTSRYGAPQDLMALVDALHQRGIGVILDWVPSHFPTDSHGLGLFDGTHLFEHADPRRGFHPDWDSYIFNYGRHEVRSFLISSALFWLDRYHVDGLRVDAVASMLYLDYSRQAGEWIPNQHGGREDLEAIAFLQRLNEAVYQEFPDVRRSPRNRPRGRGVAATDSGGLGFGFKWDLGWMHDTLVYLHGDPVHRRPPPP